MAVSRGGGGSGSGGRSLLQEKNEIIAYDVMMIKKIGSFFITLRFMARRFNRSRRLVINPFAIKLSTKAAKVNG